MKLWVDDIRTAPNGYVWCRTVNEAKFAIEFRERLNGIEMSRIYSFLRSSGLPEMYPWTYYDGVTTEVIAPFELIDIDHDAGEYAADGGDYIKLLDWLEETDRSYPIHIHSMNPVGVQNMQAIIRKNNWKEV